MIDPDFIDRVVSSEWVRQKKDENGKDTWGHELVEGAPPEIVDQFYELQELLELERHMHGEHEVGEKPRSY